ncbi:hypothetical protein Tco_1274051 [Tanacetum coccineum]
MREKSVGSTAPLRIVEEMRKRSISYMHWKILSPSTKVFFIELDLSHIKMKILEYMSSPTLMNSLRGSSCHSWCFVIHSSKTVRNEWRMFTVLVMKEYLFMEHPVQWKFTSKNQLIQSAPWSQAASGTVETSN